MGVLSDSGGSGLAGADGPDRLVSDDDVGPGSDGSLDGIELSLEDIISVTGLTLLESLTDAKNCLKASSLSTLDLLGYDLIGLLVELSTLGVTNEGPLESEVLDLLSRDLASEGAVCVSADVLGCDSDI